MVDAGGAVDLFRNSKTAKQNPKEVFLKSAIEKGVLACYINHLMTWGCSGFDRLGSGVDCMSRMTVGLANHRLNK